MSQLAGNMTHWHKGQFVSSNEPDSALATCHESFPRWRDTPLSKRKEVLVNAAQLLDERRHDVKRIMLDEVPMPGIFADIINIETSVAMMRTLAAQADQALASEDFEMPNIGRGRLSRVPYGVALSMASWNAPLVLSCRAVAGPLITGNACLLKASELAPRTQGIWGPLFKEAGLPDGVLEIFSTEASQSPSVVESLIADDRVRHVNFTGSERVGRAIGSLAGKHLKPSILELGGKAPSLILPDADLKVAASHCLCGAWLHQGQICMSTERAIATEAIYDKFVELTTAMIKEKEPFGQEARIPQVSEAGARKGEELIREAIDKGARAITHGDSFSRSGAYITPTMLVGVTPDMRVYHEETFAPVFVLLKATDNEHALRIANESPYGLASAVFGSEDTAFDIAQRIEAGATHINSMTPFDHPYMPFGGFKNSGYGRFNSFEGMREFTQTKAVTIREPAMAPL